MSLRHRGSVPWSRSLQAYRCPLNRVNSILLLLNVKDNVHETDGFFLNIAYNAVAYAFDSTDRRSGKLL
jgi:hypothetical protein